MPMPIVPNEHGQIEPESTFAEFLDTQEKWARGDSRRYERDAAYYQGKADMAAGILGEWNERQARAVVEQEDTDEDC